MAFLKRIKMIIAAVILTVAISSCSMNYPICATSNPVGSRVGMADGSGYLMGLTFFGEASIRNAAKNGGITKISTVDFKVTNTLFLYQTYTCIVTGE